MITCERVIENSSRCTTYINKDANILKEMTHHPVDVSSVLIYPYLNSIELIYPYLNSFDDEPSMIGRNKRGELIEKGWHKDGRYHRDHAPAEICYNMDGSILRESWMLNGVYDRHDSEKPCVVWYYEDGSIRSEQWYIVGRYHRDHGPAIVRY